MLNINRLQLQNLHKLQLAQFASAIAKFSAVIAVLVGVLVLCDSFFEIEFLKRSSGTGLVTNKPNAALCFLISGLSLWLLQIGQGKRDRSAIYYLRVSRICALAVTWFALLTLSQYLFGWNFGIDELLFQDKSNDLYTYYPGRIGFKTALNFILVGIALENLAQAKHRHIYWYVQIFALIASVVSLQVLISYAYQVQIFPHIASYTTLMALHTGLTFIVLCVGILCVHPNQGLMQVIISETYGGFIARRFLLAAIAIPLILGWLILQGQVAGKYGSAFALSLFAIILIGIFGIFIWHSSAVILRLCSQHDEAEQKLRAYEEKLRSLVDANIFESDVIHQNGKVVKLLEYVAPLFDEEGKSRGSVGAFLDITEGKQVESAIQNQQKWLEDLLDMMPLPLLFIEPETARVTFANRAANELAGGEFPKGVPGEEYHTVYDCTDGAGNPIPNEQMPGVRVARGECLDGIEIDWHTNGYVRSLLIFADTLPAMQGHPAICVLALQDITNIKEMEKAKTLGYKRLQLLSNTASDLLSSQQPLALIDSCFRKLAEQIGLDVYLNYLVEDNSQVMRLASFTGFYEDIAKKYESLELGKSVCGTVAQQRHPLYIANVQQSTDPKTELIRNLGITACYSYPLIASERVLGTLCFGSRSRSYFTENQKGMMQAVCDQIAIALERANLIASLRQQTEQLREANRIKDEFLAVLSHELRSPLNAILGWAQLLRQRKLSDIQMAKAMETIERNARTQAQLIEDLLDISGMIRGKLHLNVCTCDLVPLIKSAMETVKLAAQAKKIDLQFSLVPDPEMPHNHSKFSVAGDIDRLQQIIWNLLSNAIKFTPTGGRVEIKLSQSIDHSQELPQAMTNYAQIQVIDRGIGIKPEFLPYVFDRFRQADSSSTRCYGGLGLGLAIVYHLVELHGGTITVDSPGEKQGAIFTVKLPLLLQNQPVISDSVTRERGDFLDPLLVPTLLGVRILVVDDEIDTRDFITTVLQQCQGEVQAVGSVAEALKIISEWQPDVLVSDIAMPEEDGYSLIRKVRSQPPAQGGNIPAAALTAYAKAEERTRAIQEGYQLHLPKPIEPVELATVVASLVNRE